jgi:uncharacterized protein YfiM (DUF2279 family)
VAEVRVTGTREEREHRAAWEAREAEEARRVVEVPVIAARRAVACAVVDHGMAQDAALSHLSLGQLSASGEAVAPGEGIQRARVDETAEQLHALNLEIMATRRARDGARSASPAAREGLRERVRASKPSPARVAEAQRLLDGGAEPRDEVRCIR